MKFADYRKRAGQNTVEYLLILAVIVGVVLIVGVSLKRYMPSLFERVSAQITDTANRMGGASGNRE